ncbi:hypothetical protein QMK19_18285 [Streptomyces sp. H10-C2]|uniref:hypothetical protein n=1 Tax=unclassified Streptomyces TaxID=2593676 RepID=UPI0024BAEBA7|nr:MULTISPECIES: hypothetical protein [unclassified Streptomyces]MDJ0343499.1 hypothetical protein [Streptomyces sp. PH10-H1]MDJ0371579.1 hypothetical protein [Streptomyces sp. H10-C2]
MKKKILVIIAVCVGVCAVGSAVTPVLKKHDFGDGPALEADWRPQDVGDDAGRPECSEMYQFRVAVKGDQVYARSNGDLTHASNSRP